MAANLIQLPRGRTKRDKLWLAMGGKCHWCGVMTILPDNHWNTATRDHILPRYKGGTDALENVVLACYRCNNRRSHEDARGLQEGTLLGKYKQGQTGIVSPNAMNRVCLTGEEKKAIADGQVLPVLKAAKAESVLREQRDQFMKALQETRAQLKHYDIVVRQQEAELKELKSASLWKLFRKRLAARIAPR